MICASAVTPEKYGALGNGLTDDTTSIQKCVKDNRNVVFAKGKVYRVTGNITVPSDTVVDLNSSTVLTNDGKTVTKFLNADGTFNTFSSSCFLLQNANNVTIKNGKIAQCVNGIKCNSSNNLIFSQLEIYWCGYGISCNTGNSHHLSDLYLHDNRTFCLSLIKVSNATYTNIKIYNPGVWGIYTLYIDACHWTNVSVSFDTSYATFYGGATKGVMNVAFLNKQYDGKWNYTSGQKTVEHTAYAYEIRNTTFNNCDWSMAGVATKFCTNFVNNNFTNCKFNLYWCQPNTNGKGNFKASKQQFDKCTVNGLFLNSYTPDGAGWDLQFTNCIIKSIVSPHNMNNGTGVVSNSHLVFNNCTLTYSNQEMEFGAFTGSVEFNGCAFYPNTSNPQACYAFHFTNSRLATSMTLSLTQCSFNNSHKSYYPLIFYNHQALKGSPKITVTNCTFVKTNNKTISNTNCDVVRGA